MKKYISLLCLSMLAAQPLLSVDFAADETESVQKKPKLSKADILKLAGGIASIGTLAAVGIWFFVFNKDSQIDQSSTQSSAPVSGKKASQGKSTNRRNPARQQQQEPTNAVIAPAIVSGIEWFDQEVEAVQNVGPRVMVRLVRIGQRLFGMYRQGATLVRAQNAGQATPESVPAAQAGNVIANMLDSLFERPANGQQRNQQTQRPTQAARAPQRATQPATDDVDSAQETIFHIHNLNTLREEARHNAPIGEEQILADQQAMDQLMRDQREQLAAGMQMIFGTVSEMIENDPELAAQLSDPAILETFSAALGGQSRGVVQEGRVEEVTEDETPLEKNKNS